MTTIVTSIVSKVDLDVKNHSNEMCRISYVQILDTINVQVNTAPTKLPTNLF